MVEIVRKASADSGFATAGIAAVPEPGSAEDYAELRLVEPWLAEGRGGEMEYLKRRDEAGRLLRSSLRVALPWARSVIVCAANYNSAAPKSIDDCSNRIGGGSPDTHGQASVMERAERSDHPITTRCCCGDCEVS